MTLEHYCTVALGSSAYLQATDSVNVQLMLLQGAQEATGVTNTTYTSVPETSPVLKVKPAFPDP